jgi:hypothetical protein
MDTTTKVLVDTVKDTAKVVAEQGGHGKLFYALAALVVLAILFGAYKFFTRDKVYVSGSGTGSDVSGSSENRPGNRRDM